MPSCPTTTTQKNVGIFNKPIGNQRMTQQKKIIKFFCLTIFVLLFQFSLFAQTITKGPYLVDPGNNSITIRWESDCKIDFKVFYGLNKSISDFQKAEFIAEKKGHFLYQAKIENLIGGKTYYYRVSGKKVKSQESAFTTLSSKSSSISFAVMGDSRSKPHIFEKIVDQINKKNPDLILSSGDLVGQGGDYEQWGEHYFNAASKIINHIPLFSAVGDHEADEVDGDEAVLFSHFLFPKKNHLKLWSSFDYGNAHFVALDYRHPYNAQMIEWFKKDMADSKAKWKFVIMHQPSYNFGGHCSFWGKEIWPELFRKYKVDIVFAGHSHNYERFYPTRPISQPNSFPVTYITTGGAGATLYPVVQNPFIAFAKSINHYVLVDVEKDKLSIKMILPDGAILDEVSWTKNEHGIDENYLSLIKSQEELNIMGMFAEAMATKLDRLPMGVIPALPVFNLNSKLVNEDIVFEMKLTDESRASYKMESFKGILKQGEALQVPLVIYGKKTMTITRWGEITPVLRLMVNYKTGSFQGQVKGMEMFYRAY